MNEENKEVKVEKKGNNIFIIVFLTVALIAVTGYIVYDKVISKNEVEDKKEEDSKDKEEDKVPVVRALDVKGKEVIDLLKMIASPYFYHKEVPRDAVYYYNKKIRLANDLEDSLKIELAFKETNLNCDTKEFAPKDIETYMKKVLGNDVTYKKVNFYCWPKTNIWYTGEGEQPSEFIYDGAKDLWTRKSVDGSGDVGTPFNAKIVKAIAIDEKVIEIYDKFVYSNYSEDMTKCATGDGDSYKIIDNCDISKIREDNYFDSISDKLSSVKYTFKLNEETKAYYFVSAEIVSE